MTEALSREAFRRLVLLLLNVPSHERVSQLRDAITNGEKVQSASESPIARHLRDQLAGKAVNEEILGFAAATADLLEEELAHDRAQRTKVKVVMTAPDYMYAGNRGAADSALWSGSLLHAIERLIGMAEQRLDIVSPFWSEAGAHAILEGIGSGMKGVRVRILTIMAGAIGVQNESGLRAIARAFSRAGAEVVVYSPTSEQIEAAREVPALIHAKLVVSDRKAAYLGSANFSAGGLSRALELGVVLEGEQAAFLAAQCDWFFSTTSMCMLPTEC